MRVLLCPDSFKESLSAAQVAQALAEGFERGLPGVQIQCLPLADGGEGTMEALVAATGGRYFAATVHGPLMQPQRARWAMLGDGQTAVVEMAEASGLALLHAHERKPLITTSYGTGELMAAALQAGCRRLLVAIGGSATNDGGAGMAQALGAALLDAQGQPLPPGGAALARLAHIDASAMRLQWRGVEVWAACDVRNPLTGPQGASHVYGPQKGASPAMIAQLDDSLARYARQIALHLGKQVAQVPGAGAAGGLGAGLLAFLDAQLVPGFELVAQAAQLERHIAQADLVITGEGRMDFQTQFGKTPYGVAQLAAKHGKPVIGVAGSLGKGAEVLYGKGFTSLFSIVEGPMPLAEAIENAPELLRRTGERLARLLGAVQKK